MLLGLISGVALTATVLAAEANVTKQIGRSHPSRPIDAGPGARCHSMAGDPIGHFVANHLNIRAVPR